MHLRVLCSIVFRSVAAVGVQSPNAGRTCALKPALHTVGGGERGSAEGLGSASRQIPPAHPHPGGLQGGNFGRGGGRLAVVGGGPFCEVCRFARASRSHLVGGAVHCTNSPSKDRHVSWSCNMDRATSAEGHYPVVEASRRPTSNMDPAMLAGPGYVRWQGGAALRLCFCGRLSLVSQRPPQGAFALPRQGVVCQTQSSRTIERR